jgi:hypothetical protein
VTFGLVTAGLPDIRAAAILVAAAYPGVAPAVFVALEPSGGRCPTRSFVPAFAVLLAPIFTPIFAPIFAPLFTLLFVAFFPTLLLMTVFFSLFMVLVWAGERGGRDRESEQ